MKILKYTMKPMKYVMFLCLITALIYYRSLIFHSNVNQYIDIADLMLEEKYDIEIPQHYSSGISSEGFSRDSFSETKIVNKSITVEQPIILDPQDDIKVIDLQETSVVDRQEKQEEITDVLSNDVATVEVDLAEIIRQVENKEDLMEELSETVDIINKKVDMLFVLKDSNKTDEVLIQKQASIDAIIKTDVVEKIKPLEQVEPAVDKLVVAKPAVDRPPVDKQSEKVSTELEIVSEGVSTTDIKDNKLNSKIVNNDLATNDIALADSREMLLKARQTFWNGKPQVSEKIYLDLAVLEGNDPDIYGELGNVYYAQGKWKRAGEAYYEAAVRLLALNQAHQVNYLLMIIQGLDTESAEKLRHKISG